jgi:hypothetical protein
MLMKLMGLAVVLLTAALLAVPAFAQARADLSVEWGSDEWLRNQFSVDGDIQPFCETIGQDPAALEGWLAQHPNLVNVCDNL